MKLLTLNSSDSLEIGRSQSIEPSINEFEPTQIQGTVSPFSFLHKISTDPNKKGTPDEAIQALHKRTFGAFK